MIELFISFRYLWSRKQNGFVSFVTAISLMGITLGVAALIIILSVMNGFEYELRERLLSMSAHGHITNHNNDIGDWQTIVNDIQTDENILSISPTIDFDGMLRSGTINNGVRINGVLPSYEKNMLSDKVTFIQGELNALKPDAKNILLGRVLARNLNVVLGDSILLLTPSVNQFSQIEPKLDRFLVGGIYEAGIHEYDSTLGLIHLDDAQKLININGISKLRFNIKDPILAPSISQRITERYREQQLLASDWTIQNASYFRAIKLEKTMMSLMLLLVIGVAIFNIVASLIMVVMEKRSDIAVLRTLGMSAKSIKYIFLLQGIAIGWLGILSGGALGIYTAINIPEWVPVIERFFGFQIMPGDVFYITAIPSLLASKDIIMVMIVALILTATATLYPAIQAAKINPAIALRYDH